MKTIILIFLFISTVISAQVENSYGVIPYSFAPSFYIDLANFKGSTAGKTRVDVFIQMPYSNVQFVKSDEGFSANYSVTLSFLDENKNNLILERVWREKINEKTFAATSSSANYNISYKSFELIPGKYFVRCFVEDLDSKKTVNYESNTDVLDFRDSLSISDIIIIAKRVKDINGEQLIPNVSKIVTTRDNVLAFSYEIYSDKVRNIMIEYKIKDRDKKDIFMQKIPRELDSGTTRIEHITENTKFTLGDYDLIIELIDENGKRIKGIGKKLFSQIYGFPISIKDLDKAIAQMLYIASTTEIENINSSKTFEVKLNKFIEYWKVKDPSPKTDVNEVLIEYYRRIAYANDHFESYYDGWRTDMGMIYVTLGPPNYVERHPFEYDSKPYEIWSYYDINREFIFVDQTGFGDYRLYQPVYGDWYRYRQ